MKQQQHENKKQKTKNKKQKFTNFSKVKK